MQSHDHVQDCSSLVGELRETHSFDFQKALTSFNELMEAVEKTGAVTKWEDIMELYNIEGYSIRELDSDLVKTLYQQITARYRNPRLDTIWLENELRVFIWVMFSYSGATTKPVEDFGQQEWDLIASIFAGKTIEQLKFEWLFLPKTTCSSIDWTEEQDLLLANFMKRGEYHNRWNDIARALYNSSGKHFRKPKQCRQRWKNYLDPNIEKGKWDNQQDEKMLELVIKMGKKWSAISKILGTRTEHSVKNRYKSLLKKYKKAHSIRDKSKSTKYMHPKQLESLNKLIQGIRNQRVHPSLTVVDAYDVPKQLKQEQHSTKQETFDRFYPVSPNGAWKICDNAFSGLLNSGLPSAQSPRMISPRLISPIFIYPTPWSDDTSRLFYS